MAFDIFSSSEFYPATAQLKPLWLAIASGVLLRVRLECLPRETRRQAKRRDGRHAVKPVEAKFSFWTGVITITLNEEDFDAIRRDTPKAEGSFATEIRYLRRVSSECKMDEVEGQGESHGSGEKQSPKNGENGGQLSTDRNEPLEQSPCGETNTDDIPSFESPEARKNLLGLPQELRSRVFALAMDGSFTNKTSGPRNCVLYKEHGLSYGIVQACVSSNFDARALGLQALQLRHVLRLVCQKIHEDVKLLNSAPPMLSFCSTRCLTNFDDRFPRELRPRVKRVLV